MNNFWDGFSNKSMLRDIVMQSYPAEYLLGLAMGNDGDFVKDVAESYSYLVAEAVRKLEAMSVDAYLALVRDHYGDEVLGDILAALNEDLLFAQKFVLNEHHLYGSSRLGVKTHKRVLLRKEFSISGFEETGEIIVDEVTDSLVYVRSEVYFCRVLAQKQYEMTNHLGNVLATVLDRRTGVFDEGADTLMYYVADVVSATLYYPFGSSMMGYSNEEFAYSYGMNTQEKDDEIYGKGNSYSAEYWQYDSRLGRRWNNDPRPNPSISPYACFANNPIWFSDIVGDTIFISSATQPDAYMYVPGQDYNGEDEFICKTVTALNKIYFGGNKGTEMINALNTMEEHSNISMGNENGRNSGSAASGFNVRWDPDGTKTGFDENRNTSTEPFIILGHELSHVWDYKYKFTESNLGVGMYETWYTMGGANIPQAEKFACHIENMLRAENNLPLRTHYGIFNNADGTQTPTGRVLNGNYSVFFKEIFTLTFEPEWSSFRDDGNSTPATIIEYSSPYRYK